MVDSTLIGAVALMITAILSIATIYFRSRYQIVKVLVQDFIDIANQIANAIDDDKITEAELNSLVISLKKLARKAQDLL